MLQEDSNGESSFEFIEKKSREVDAPGTGSGTSLSSISPDYSYGGNATGGGNILSNVRPPTTLPDISIWTPTTAAPVEPQLVQPPPRTAVVTTPKPTAAPLPQQPPPLPITQPLMYSVPQQQPLSQQPTITPAIPVGAAFQTFPPSMMGGQQQEPYADSSAGGGFMDMVKGALPGKGVFMRMAEKAKSSVDSIITTLDPQMSEYIYSGGDLEVTVTSKNDEEVSAVREAFHSVLGKAWVNGVDLSLPQKQALMTGFEGGFLAAEEKIEYSLKYRRTPTLAVESILLQQDKNWFHLDLLLLKDYERQINFQTFTQGTPLPVQEFLTIIERERPNCSSLPIEEKLTLYFQGHPNWQWEHSGVTRKETVLLAAKVLAKMYKSKICSNQ